VKLNKRKVIEKLVILPKTNKRPFWAREMKMLNSLMSQFKNDGFWHKLSFPQKYDSLAYFLSEYGKKMLKKRFNEYNYSLPEIKIPKLGDKVGEDRHFDKKPTTIKQFFK